MAKDPNKPRPAKAAARPEESAVLLKAELRRRGMSDAEIEGALRKKKRRKVLEFDAVQSRHMMPHDINSPAIKPAARGREARGRASDELCTVDFAAEQLQLHPKTVLRFIREGRLRATRIGKSYRILRADLQAFAGMPATAPAPAEPPRVTSIVDVPGVGPDLAQKWARTLPSAVIARPQDGPPMRVDVVYDPERSHLKLILVGAPGDTATALRLIEVWLEQLQP